MIRCVHRVLWSLLLSKRPGTLSFDNKDQHNWWLFVSGGQDNTSAWICTSTTTLICLGCLIVPARLWLEDRRKNVELSTSRRLNNFCSYWSGPGCHAELSQLMIEIISWHLSNMLKLNRALCASKLYFRLHRAQEIFPNCGNITTIPEIPKVQTNFESLLLTESLFCTHVSLAHVNV